MKPSNTEIEKLAHAVINDLKKTNQLTFKSSEEQVYRRAYEIVKANFEQEAELDREVHEMMDQLEQQNAGDFQRYKMFPMLKKKLAQQKGFVL